MIEILRLFFLKTKDQNMIEYHKIDCFDYKSILIIFIYYILLIKNIIINKISHLNVINSIDKINDNRRPC